MLKNSVLDCSYMIEVCLVNVSNINTVDENSVDIPEDATVEEEEEEEGEGEDEDDVVLEEMVETQEEEGGSEIEM